MSTTPFKFPLEEQKEMFPELVSNYPPDSYMSQPEDGLVQEVHIKFFKQDDKMNIVTTKRRFFKDNDYQDSTYSEIL